VGGGISTNPGVYVRVGTALESLPRVGLDQLRGQPPALSRDLLSRVFPDKEIND